MLKLLAAASGLFFMVGCGSSDSASKSTITTTRVRPPVQESLPASLLASGTFTLADGDVDYSKTCQTDPQAGDACSSLSGSTKLRCIIKNRLFCSGPTEVLNLVDSLDARLEEIELRTAGTEVTCINEEAVDLSSQLDLPGDAVATGKFQCQDSSIGLGFGKVEDTWYVRVAQGASGQSFEVSPDSSVHGFIWLPSKDGSLSMSTGLLEISRDSEAKTVEITGGGAGFGFCGLHYQSNASFIYIKMNPDGVGGSCDYTGNSVTDSSDWVEACLDAETLDDAAAGSCDALKVFKLATLGRDTTPGTGLVTTYAAVAPLSVGTVVKFEMKDYLNSLFTTAASYTGVSELKATTLRK